MWMMALYVTAIFVTVSYIATAIKERKILIFADCTNGNAIERFICDFFVTSFWMVLYSAFIYMCACFAIAILGMAMLIVVGVPLLVVCIIMWFTSK